MRGLVARVGQEWLLFPVDCALEVLDAPRASPLPGTRAALEGVVALRGMVLPLWRTDRVLQLPARPGDPAPRVCVRALVRGTQVCLLVDDVHGLVDVGNDLGPSDAWWTDGSVHLRIGGRPETVTVLDVAALAARLVAA